MWMKIGEFLDREWLLLVIPSIALIAVGFLTVCPATTADPVVQVADFCEEYHVHRIDVEQVRDQQSSNYDAIADLVQMQFVP